MKILTINKQIEKTICSLMKRYDRYYIASAWASVGTNAFKLLLKNDVKIYRMIVGTHFYQTHPDFIKNFLRNKNTKFMPNTGGVFHPKIFLFSTSSSQWECVIGSANFTKAAFSINNEIMVHISSSDDNASEIFSQITSEFASYWSQAEYFSEKHYMAYESVWKNKQKTIEKLKGNYGKTKSKKPLFQSTIFSLSWDSYLNLVNKDPFHSFKNRLKLLDEARELFTVHSHFNEMSKENRRKIAGLDFVEQPDGFTWAWFGSMKGAGRFQNKINTNNEFISLALDCIPTNTNCSRKDYFSFVAKFKQAFPEGGAGIAIASRLLAMKRPDFFICLDNKNKDNLCEEFGISKTISFEKYWDEIIERIIDSVWWLSHRPETQIELQLWHGRAAMLDAVFYDESS